MCGSISRPVGAARQPFARRTVSEHLPRNRDHGTFEADASTDDASSTRARPLERPQSPRPRWLSDTAAASLARLTEPAADAAGDHGDLPAPLSAADADRQQSAESAQISTPSSGNTGNSGNAPPADAAAALEAVRARQVERDQAEADRERQQRERDEAWRARERATIRELAELPPDETPEELAAVQTLAERYRDTPEAEELRRERTEAYALGERHARERMAREALKKKRSRQQALCLATEVVRVRQAESMREAKAQAQLAKRARDELDPENKPAPERSEDERAELRERRRGQEIKQWNAPPKSGKSIRAEQKQAERDERWKARFVADHESWDAVGSEPPERIPREVWVMCWMIVGDHSGRAARMYLRWARSRFGGWALARIRDAAMQPNDQGECRYTWADDRARRITALGLLLLRCSHNATRRQAFGSASTKVGRLVKSINEEALCSALAMPWDLSDKPSAKNIGAAVPRSGRPNEAPWLGYIAALDEAGFLERGRVPLEVAGDNEIGRWSGHTINRYWIADPLLNANPQRGSGRGVSYESVGDTTASNAIGWWWCEEELVRAPSRAEQRKVALMAAIFSYFPSQPPPD